MSAMASCTVTSITFQYIGVLFNDLFIIRYSAIHDVNNNIICAHMDLNWHYVICYMEKYTSGYFC